MTVGMLVWCTITVTLNVFNTKAIDNYETVAEGRILEIKGENIVVDFRDYAKKHGYIGNYNSMHIKDYQCTDAHE